MNTTFKFGIMILAVACGLILPGGPGSRKERRKWH